MKRLMFYHGFTKIQRPPYEETFGCFVCDPFFAYNSAYENWNPLAGEPEPVLVPCKWCQDRLALPDRVVLNRFYYEHCDRKIII